MKKIYSLILVFCMLLSASSALAQDNLRKGNARKTSTTETKVTPARPRTATTKPQGKTAKMADTLYCSRTKKQHGWFAPGDTITKEHASHLNLSYRFTMKNKAGHWGRLECLNGYGKYTLGITPYILKINKSDYDQYTNEDWVDKLKTACIYEFIGDYTGENIIQERAYDENMNIIYTYSRVPIGNNQYIGSYKDSYGLPAEMRTEEGYTYGTLVKITEDRFGNDSIIQYIDAKGLPKLNSDSAYMEVYICDEQGRPLKTQSRNKDGSLAIDSWGNCGVEHVWNGNCHVYATSMDDQWQPMRLTTERLVMEMNTIRHNFKYDSLGRQLEQYFTDNEGRPDTNAFGTHKIVYQYDNHGDQTEICAYDLTGHLTSLDNRGIAIFRHKYDSIGRNIFSEFIDKNNKPFSKDNNVSKWEIRYDGDGNQIYYALYEAPDGEEVLSYKHEKRDNYEYYLWTDGTSRIDSFDAKGRLTFEGYYNQSGTLYMLNGRAFQKNDYQDNGKTTTSTRVYYDSVGNKVDVDGTCTEVSIIDSVAWITTYWRYNSDDILVQSFILQYDSGFNKSLAQYDANIWGKITRCGGSSPMFFAVECMRNQKGEFVSWVAKDEFGEPDYILDSDGDPYYYRLQYPTKPWVWFDEDNHKIENFYEFKQALPQVMTIEIVDSIAYAYGLRDNDVVLLYGDYALDLQNPSHCLREWSLHSVLDARKSKRMVVFRIEDAANQKFGLVEINGLQGTPSELGFMAHLRYLTKRQTTRILNAIADNMASDRPLVREADFEHSEENFYYVLVSYPDFPREYRNNTYGKSVSDPSIALGACIPAWNLEWDMQNEEAIVWSDMTYNYRSYFAEHYPELNLFFTKDMETVIQVDTKERNIHYDWNYAFVAISERDYDRLLELNKQVKTRIQQILSEPKEQSVVSTADLVSQWRIVDQHTQDKYAPSGSLYLAKDGNCFGTIVDYATLPLTEEDYAIVKIEHYYDGRWSNDGTFLSFSPNQDLKLTVVELVGDFPEGFDKDRYGRFLTDRMNPYFYYYLSQMNFDHHWLYKTRLWGDVFIIRSLRGDTLTIETNLKDGLQLVREKDVPKIARFSNKKKSKPMEIEDLPILGKWESNLEKVSGVKHSISFNLDRSMEQHFSASWQDMLSDSVPVDVLLELILTGTWNLEGDTLQLQHDPTLTQTAFDFLGVGEETRSQLISAYSQISDAEKEDLVRQLLEGTPFEGKSALSQKASNVFKLGEFTLSYLTEWVPVVRLFVNTDSGYLKDRGYTGMFYVLQMNDWNCTMSIDDYQSELEKTTGQKKHFTLLPVQQDSKNNFIYGDIVEFTREKLGVWIRYDGSVGIRVFQNQVLQRYLLWKKRHKSRK